MSEKPSEPGREALIERMCAAFVSEADGLFPFEVWPTHPDDDGNRGANAYVRLMSEDTQHEIRCAMGFALDAALEGKAP